jgi:hypothetical protein
MMVSFFYPIMNVHGINSTNNIPLTCARYGSSYSLNNMHEGGDLEIPNLVAPNEQAITISHLKNL